MRLTLETSALKVTMDATSDDLTEDELMALMRAAMIAHGYALTAWTEAAEPADMRPAHARSGRRSTRAAAAAAPKR